MPNGLTFADPPLYKYVLLAEYGVTFGLDRLDGHAHSAQEFVDHFRGNPSRLYLIARATSALFGAATVIAAGALARELRGNRAGLIAAALACVTFLLVRESHFGVDDALVALLVTVGLLFCVRQHQVIAGVFAGLAFAAKYDGIALLVPVFLVRRPGGRLAIALLACVGAALVTFPSLIIEPARVVNDIYVHDVLEAASGYDGLDPSGGYVFYARALAIGLGWPLLIASIAGLGLTLKNRDRGALIVASFPVTLLLVLGSQKLYFARFALPAAPALIVLASITLDALLTGRALIGLVALVLTIVPTSVDSVRFDDLLTRTDTRTLATEWLASGLPEDAHIAVDAAPLGPTLNGPNVLLANDVALYDLSASDYVERGVDYLVVSSFVEEARAIDPAREARRLAFNAALAQQGTLVAEFKAYSGPSEPAFMYDQIYGPWSALGELSRPGPTIRVYRLSR